MCLRLYIFQGKRDGSSTYLQPVPEKWMHAIANGSRFVLGLTLALGLASPSLAVVILNNGALNIIDGSSSTTETFEVRNGAGGTTTRVSVNAGANIGNDRLDLSLRLSGQSTGTINGGQTSHAVVTIGNSQLEVRGGAIGTDLFAHVNSRVDISGGTVARDVELSERAHLNMSGGVIVNDVILRLAATANITGGNILDDLVGSGNSLINFRGKVADDVEARAASTIYINGGEIGMDIEAFAMGSIFIKGGLLGTGGIFDTGFAARGNGLISLSGARFMVNGAPAPYGHIAASAGTLSGYLADGSFFEMPFERSQHGQIVLTVPVPGSLPLVVLGLLALQWRRKAGQLTLWH
jgi:uncharacterized protein (TIGR03382 family)